MSNKVSFFVKTSEFKYHTDEVKLPEFTADPGVILDAIEKKFKKLLPPRKNIRSTGITLHNLIREEDVLLDLFGKQEKKLKTLIIEEMADKLREKYGDGIIKRVASMRKSEIKEKDSKKD